MDDRAFRKAMGKFATGVTVITTEVNGNVRGMTANAFMSVSLDPKLVLISIAHKARMHDMIKRSESFAVNILSTEQQDMSMIFAGQIKEEQNVAFETFAGLPVIKDCLVNIACHVHDSYKAGDHTLFIGEVLDLRVREGEPLAFFDGQYKQIS